MIHSLLVGVLAISLALGSMFATGYVRNGASPAAAHAAPGAEEAGAKETGGHGAGAEAPAAGEHGSAKGPELVKTEMTSVPIIRDGKIEGYVVFQLAFSINPAGAATLGTDPAPFLIDGAFRHFYENSAINFREIAKYDVEALAKDLTSETNKRLGADVVRDVLVQQINYLDKEGVRAGEGRIQ